MTPAPDIELVLAGGEPLRLDQLLAVAAGRARLALDPSDAVRGRVRASAECVARLLAGGQRIYGVTTGFGHSVTTSVPADLASELPLNLLRFQVEKHGVEYLSGQLYLEPYPMDLLLDRRTA